ncbi:MAG: hypothetical protein HY822_01680, partial [Acidobacteria bacterium]|nr:hypothetical protein [Acidobacteriota bacterium]
IEGGELLFKIAVDGAYTIKCTVAGDSMKGSWTAPDGSTGPVTATRASAALAGKWKLNAKRPQGGEYNVEFEIKEEAGKLAGTLLADGAALPLQDVKLEGQDLSFKIAAPNGAYALKLTVAENAMKGSFTGPDSEAGPVTVTR